MQMRFVPIGCVFGQRTSAVTGFLHDRPDLVPDELCHRVVGDLVRQNIVEGAEERARAFLPALPFESVASTQLGQGCNLLRTVSVTAPDRETARLLADLARGHQWQLSRSLRSKSLYV